VSDWGPPIPLPAMPPHRVPSTYLVVKARSRDELSIEADCIRQDDGMFSFWRSDCEGELFVVYALAAKLVTSIRKADAKVVEKLYVAKTKRKSKKAKKSKPVLRVVKDSRNAA
jgi:hypothetical protein